MKHTQFVFSTKTFYEGFLMVEELLSPGFVIGPDDPSVFGCPTRTSSNGRAGLTRLLFSLVGDLLDALVKLIPKK
jgi:hypothetical protein